MNDDLSPLRSQRLVVRSGEPGSKPNPAVVYCEAKAPGSRATVRAVLRKLAGWLMGLDGPATWVDVARLPWWEVRARHVSVLRARLEENAAPRTVNRDLSLLRGVLTVAWENEQMEDEAYHRAIHVKGVAKDASKSGRSLSADEIRSLMGATSEMSRPRGELAAAMLALMYGAGLRRFELTRLEIGDVDLVTGAIRIVGKRNKPRDCYIATGWIRYLRAWIDIRGDTTGPFFCHGSERTPYSAWSVAALTEEVRQKAGVDPFTPHDLRRSFGTHLIGATGDINLVRDLMGHSDIRTTAIYDMRGEGEKSAAVQLLDPEKEAVARMIVNGAPPPKAEYSLEEIFHFQDGFGEYDHSRIDDLQSALRDGCVTVSIVHLPFRRYSATHLRLFSGRTDEHRTLCAQVADWMEARGWSWRPSQHYAGGISDVSDLAGRLDAECGYTKVSKVLAAIRRRTSVLVVPYLGTDPTAGFLFEPTEKRMAPDDPVARGASKEVR